MSATFGAAVWIGSTHPFDLHEVYLDFASPVVKGDVGEAVELLISADSRYKLWLNDQFINRGPARSYPHAQAYDRLDLSPHWQAGENRLTVRVYQPGYSHFCYVHRAAAGMIAALFVDGERRLVTDTSWQVRRNRSFDSDVPRVSIYGSGVERRRLDVADSAENWQPARVVAEANRPIWSGLHERVTPLLVESLAAARLVESRLSVSEVSWDTPHAGVRDAWAQGSAVTFAVDDAGWIRPKFAPNQTAIWLFDLGRAYTCQGGAAIRGASGGETLTISYADKMVDGALVISDPTTYCRVQLSDSFALGAGTQTVEPFQMRGGRYVLFQLAGELGDSFAFRPLIRIAEYPLEITKPFVTDDPQLAAIATMCENTVRACLQDSFVDCVWRESSQWLGDGLIQAKTLAAMCDDFRPMQKMLSDSATGQRGNGMIPSIAPGEVHAYTIPRYACMWVELLAFYIAQSGDVAFAQPSVEVLEDNRFIATTLSLLVQFFYFGARERADGLHVTPVGLRHYIDWSPASQNDPHAVYNLHVVLALQQAAWISGQMKSAERETHCYSEATDLRTRCRAAFYADGIWWDDLERTTYSQLAAAMALLVGAVAPDEQDALLDAIIARSLDPSDDHRTGEMVLASPFMHHYIFEALGKFGRKQAIIDIIKLRWGRWVAQGEPTTWENWNIDFPDGSACHAFSAHPRYHLMLATNAVGD